MISRKDRKRPRVGLEVLEGRNAPSHAGMASLAAHAAAEVRREHRGGHAEVHMQDRRGHHQGATVALQARENRGPGKLAAPGNPQPGRDDGAAHDVDDDRGVPDEAPDHDLNDDNGAPDDAPDHDANDEVHHRRRGR